MVRWIRSWFFMLGLVSVPGRRNMEETFRFPGGTRSVVLHHEAAILQSLDECEALMENTQKPTVTHTCWSSWRFQCVGCGFGCFEGRASDQRRPLLPRARETNHSFHFPFQLLSISVFLWMMAHLSRCYWKWLFRVRLDQLRSVGPRSWSRSFFRESQTQHINLNFQAQYWVSAVDSATWAHACGLRFRHSAAPSHISWFSSFEGLFETREFEKTSFLTTVTLSACACFLSQMFGDWWNADSVEVNAVSPPICSHWLIDWLIDSSLGCWTFS